MKFITVIPFLGLLVLVYIAIAMGIGAGVFNVSGGTVTDFLAQPVFSVTALGSTTPDNPWIMSIGDLFIVVAILFLAVEIVRATRTDKISMGNHALSMVVMLGSVIAFVLIPGFGTSVFFILTLMTILDVLVGMFVSIITARRDFGIAPGLGN